ncbi:2-dehydro-3-deoxyphosphooctonate aldolase [Amylibacter ulvae]|uniref:2-dehydro-3-deoxyphosphooctonate aldolase n=1 Tax=Paramylibacter ulvae TaxID=1651968 RepID=A0ABQ3CV78_9RHOB|nr:3-deoxy-8-phosphooctulonate synthase [Amylibacter ulvae]GHA45510.1 2-dehydro-3-deoxyphosphooctonate aldolase [Amylibacter ulvae]
MKRISVGQVTIGNDEPFVLIAGPCQLESANHGAIIAGRLAEICAKLGVGFVFKASFDKANRTSHAGQRGMGLDAGLAALAAIKSDIGCPIITDVHHPEQCDAVADVADILQIPAFLCRQTDLLQAAAKTNAVINVKKGQFLAPWDMEHVIEKVTRAGNAHVLLTERGTSFGYNTLVTDMRALPQMAKTGYPIIMDATHSVQQPGGMGGASGGQREFAPVMARAAISLGIAGVFIETHDQPEKAPSDGPNMIALDEMPNLIESLKLFDEIAKSNPIRI